MTTTPLFLFSSSFLLALFLAFYHFPLIFTLPLGLSFFLFLNKRYWLTWLSLFLAFFFLGGYYFSQGISQIERKEKPFEITIKIERVEPYYEGYKVLAKLLGDTSGLIEFTTTYPNFSLGKLCKIVLTEKKSIFLENPYTFSFQERFMIKEVVGEYKNIELEKIFCIASEGSFLENLRYRLFQFSERLSPLAKGLLQALVLGVENQLPKEYLQVLKEQGLYHQLAISGFNLAVLYGLLYKFWRFLLSYTFLIRGPLPLQLWAHLFSLPGAFLSLLLSGFQASTSRAFFFLVIFLLSRLLFRRTPPFLLLMLTGTLLVLFKPSLIGNFSFQLSFLATLALILGHQFFEKRLPPLGESFLSKLFRKGVYALGISSFVSLITFPLIFFLSGEIALATPLNNLIATPFWSLLFIPFSIFSALLAFIYEPLAVFLLETLGRIFSFYLELPLFRWVGRVSLPVNLFLIWLFVFFLMGSFLLKLPLKRLYQMIGILFFGTLSYFFLFHQYKKTFFIFIPKLFSQQVFLIKAQKEFYLIVNERRENEIERDFFIIPLLKKLGVKEIEAIFSFYPLKNFKSYQRAFEVKRIYTSEDFEIFEDLRLFKPGLEVIPLKEKEFLLEMEGLSVLFKKGRENPSLFEGVEIFYLLKSPKNWENRERLLWIEEKRNSALFLFKEGENFIIIDEKERKKSFFSCFFFPFGIRGKKFFLNFY